MKPHVLVTGATGYIGSVPPQTKRSPDDGIQELLKGYRILG
jgi:hypothetical protein